MQFVHIAVHQRDKLRLAAGNIIRQRHAGIVAGVNDEPAAQVAYANPIARLKKHQGRSLKDRIALRPGIFTDGDDVVKGDAVAVDGAIDHIAGHQFGQAGGIALLMLVTGGKDLAGGVIHQHPGTGLNGRRRHVDGKIIGGKCAGNARSEQRYSNKQTAFQRHIL